jgi:hypothetical protein
MITNFTRICIRSLLCVRYFVLECWQYGPEFLRKTGVRIILIVQIRLYVRDIYRQSGEVNMKILPSHLIKSNSHRLFTTMYYNSFTSYVLHALQIFSLHCHMYFKHYVGIYIICMYTLYVTNTV